MLNRILNKKKNNNKSQQITKITFLFQKGQILTSLQSIVPIKLVSPIDMIKNSHSIYHFCETFWFEISCLALRVVANMLLLSYVTQ